VYVILGYVLPDLIINVFRVLLYITVLTITASFFVGLVLLIYATYHSRKGIV